MLPAPRSGRTGRGEQTVVFGDAEGLGELAAFLTDHAVQTVAMEATGVYWKAPFYALEGLFDEVWLCNAQHVKNVALV